MYGLDFNRPEMRGMGGGWGGQQQMMGPPQQDGMGQGFAAPDFMRMLQARFGQQMPQFRGGGPANGGTMGILESQLAGPGGDDQQMPMRGPGGMMPGLTNTFQRLKAQRTAAETFGRRPAPQGEGGPGMRGESGGFAPTLGRRFVANNFRTQAPGVK